MNIPVYDPYRRPRPVLRLVQPGRRIAVDPIQPAIPGPIELPVTSGQRPDRNIEPKFSVRRVRVPVAGQPGRFYTYAVAWQGLKSHQRLRWGNHRLVVHVGKGGGVLLVGKHHKHKFKSRQDAAAHLSKVMNKAAVTGGFHTDIPMTLRGGGSLGGADLGDLGARDSFGRYKEYNLPDGLVVREYRKDGLRIMRVSGQVYVSGLPVPKGSAQHARIMALIAAERSENRQERRQRAAGIAASLVESAAAGAVKGYKAKKGKKAPAVEAEDVDTGPVEEPAPASPGLPSWLLPVGIVAGLGLVVAVAMSGRGGGE